MQTTTDHRLSLDTQATLLLCGHLEKENQTSTKPLTASEYTRLTRWLIREGLRPANLLEASGVEHLRRSSADLPEFNQIERLLQRGSLLALQVEAWTNQGLWIIGRSDDAYPARWKEKLKHLSPPILYGIGNPQLLQSGGLAIVGSRDVDADGLKFSRDLAERCVQSSVTVISGGARGVDQASMIGALEVGGNAVGVLADSLMKAAVSTQYRRFLREGILVLVSPFAPNSGFSVGNAMGRNKLVYTIADWAVVVDSAAQKGGTWAGAMENLKASWVPVLVRISDGVSEGNRKLAKQGAIGFDPAIITNSNGPLAELLGRLLKDGISAPPPDSSPSLFDELSVSARSEHRDGSHEQRNVNSVGPVEKLDADSFWIEYVWPCILRLAENQGTLNRAILAEMLGVRTQQSEDWLKRAADEGKLVKQTRPTGYQLPKSDQLLLLAK